jgi:hypothetical protein
MEDIKAYQAQVEKDKITSDGLTPCPRCNLEAKFFKIHAYRERRFLLIVEMLVKSIFCSLVRFRCTRCGKTVTHYPDFALPYKHYTRQTIESFSHTYVENNKKTYETAVITNDGIPSYPDGGQMLAASTIYRWISTLAGLITSCRDTIEKSFPGFAVDRKKYRTPERRTNLLRCRYFFMLNPLKTVFHRL